MPDLLCIGMMLLHVSLLFASTFSSDVHAVCVWAVVVYVCLGLLVVYYQVTISCMEFLFSAQTSLHMLFGVRLALLVCRLHLLDFDNIFCVELVVVRGSPGSCAQISRAWVLVVCVQIEIAYGYVFVHGPALWVWTCSYNRSHLFVCGRCFCLSIYVCVYAPCFFLSARCLHIDMYIYTCINMCVCAIECTCVHLRVPMYFRNSRAYWHRFCVSKPLFICTFLVCRYLCWLMYFLLCILFVFKN